MHLAVALDGAGWHPAAWREPDARLAELFTAGYWSEQVREAARGRLDFVTIEDSVTLRTASAEPVGSEPSPRVRGRLDAIVIAARVAPLTPGVGIVPAASTTPSEPFLLSTQIATLDFVSRGRAGWLADVSLDDAVAAYVGPRQVPLGNARFQEAAEHIDVVRALWDSWEDGAEIRDASTHRFLDRGRVHPIDHEGEHFRIRGPSITPRPPQGQPVVAMLADDDATLAVAAASADVILVPAVDERALSAAPAVVERELLAAGRAPGEVRVLADIAVVLDRDASRAVQRRQWLDAHDGGRYRSDTIVFTGAADELAERLIAWQSFGYSGFRLRPAAIPHDLRAITRALVPELVDRDVFPTRYESETLRGLLGLTRPANRFASHPQIRHAVS